MCGKNFDALQFRNTRATFFFAFFSSRDSTIALNNFRAQALGLGAVPVQAAPRVALARPQLVEALALASRDVPELQLWSTTLSRLAAQQRAALGAVLVPAELLSAAPEPRRNSQAWSERCLAAIVRDDPVALARAAAADVDVTNSASGLVPGRALCCDGDGLLHHAFSSASHADSIYID